MKRKCFSLDTGEILMPKFSKLDDLVPPKWSIFHKSGAEKSRIVKISDLRRKSLSDSPRSIRSIHDSRKSNSAMNIKDENRTIHTSQKSIKSTPNSNKRNSFINIDKENEIDTILGELKLLGKLPVGDR